MVTQTAMNLLPVSERERERERDESSSGKSLSWITFFPIFLIILTAIALYTAFASPTITFISPTLSDNFTTGSNWVYINLTSSENLNQSLLEWGNSTGFTNVSMSNSSATNWYVNMTNLADYTYNYTIFAQNTTGYWNQTQRRFVYVDTTPPYLLYACQNLNIAGGYYLLARNVSSAGGCFNISANNITLDGQGWWVTYSQSVTGYGINITSRNNVTVKNLNVVQGNVGITNTRAIYTSGMTNSSIINNTVRTSGSSNYGIYLVSSTSNNVSNNEVTTITTGIGIYIVSSNTNSIINNIAKYTGVSTTAIRLDSSSSNNITGGSYTASSRDYYIYGGTSNAFINTNFTASRKIYFYDSVSYFNYNNESAGTIWLKTNVSAADTITRTLVNWNSLLMKWNDTNSTAGITARYNITGMAQTAQYLVYNTSNGVQTRAHNLTTGSNGILNFTIALNGNTEIKVTVPQPPAYSSNSTNSTFAGTSVLHSLYWTGDNDLSAYVFSFDNCTGSFVNETYPFSGAGNWSRVAKVINSTAGCTINWKVYANDTTGNMTESSVYSYITTAFTNNPPTYTNIGINSTTSNQSTKFYAYWTDDYGLSGFIFSTNNNGTWVNDTWQPFAGTGWSNVTKTLNSTTGISVSYIFYVNDTANSWTTTGIRTLVTTEAGRRNLYVATWGANSNDGLTLDSPWQNVSYVTQQAIAGDTIYLVNGTWYGEEAVFANNGTVNNPITLTAYNGTPTLIDDEDANHQAIYALGKQYINIEKITMRDYFDSIYVRQSSYISVKNVTIYFNAGEPGSPKSAAIMFNDNVHYSNMTYNKVVGIDTGLITTDMRNSVGVAGRYYDSGSQSWYSESSTDILIANNEIYGNIEHGLIDLMGTVSNITIENNILYNTTTTNGTASYSAIYYHQGFPQNITIRNNWIHDTSGINGGSALSSYQLMTNTLIENNTIFNSVDGIKLYSADDIIIRNNTIYNITSGQGIYVWGKNNFADNNNVSNAVSAEYRFVTGLNGGMNNTIRNPIGTGYRVMSTNDASITVEYTDGSVFSENGGNTPKWYPDKSVYSLVFNETVTITAYNNMTARPSSGYATITTNGVNLTSIQTDITAMASPKIWNMTIYSNNSATTATFNISTGLNSQPFSVYRNGTLYTTVTTNSTGGLNYKYAGGGFGTWEFSFQEQGSDSTPPSIIVLSPLNQSYGTNSIWFNVTLNKAGSWAGFSIDGRQNSTMVNSSGNWNLLNSSMSDGFHNVTFFANDTSNNMNLTSIYFTVDTTPPTWNGTSTSIVTTYSPTTLSQFNITWTDNTGISTVFLESNHSGAPTNYTMSHSGGGNYTFNATMPAGTYYWRSYANDTANNRNASTAIGFTVNKAANPAITMYINSAVPNQNSTIAYGTTTNVTITTPASQSLTIYRNGTIAGSTTGTSLTYLGTTLSASYYNFTAVAEGNQNYTASFTTYFQTINKAATLTRLFLNGTESDGQYTVGQQANFTAVLNVTGKTVYLNTNITGWSLQSGTVSVANYTSISSPGVYNITAYFAGDSNYLASSQTYFATVSDITPPKITIQSPTNTTYYTSSIWFNITLNKAGSWAGFSIDGRTNNTMTNSSGNWNLLNSSMADGFHNVTFFANDTSNNMNLTSIYFTVDTTPPKITIQSPANTTYYNSSIWFNITLNKVGSWAGLSIDGRPNATLANSSGNWNLLNSSMSDGFHNVTFYANDTSNNMNLTSIYFTVDTTPSIITIQSPTNTTYYTNAVWFNITLNKAGSWAGFSIDGQPNATLINSSGNWNLLNSSMSNGFHNATFYANDTSNNMNSTSIYFTVDTTLPTITIQSPLNQTYSTNSIWFNVTLNKAGSWAGLSIDGRPNATLANSSGNWNLLNSSMSDGRHTAVFHANDTAGNMNATNVTFTVDTTPPQITFALPTWTNASLRSESWEYVNITLNEEGSVSLLEWSNATITANYSMTGSGTTNFYLNMTNQNGTVWYSVYANDTMGNMNVSEMRKVTLNYSFDVNPPQITVISPLNASYPRNWLWANVSLDEPGAWCGISLNGTANLTLSNTSATYWYLNLSVPAEGQNNVTFYCNDTIGNQGPSATTYFTIDTVQPRPTIQSPLNRTYSTNSIWFNLTTNEPGSWAGYSLDSASNNVTLTNSSGNWNLLNSSMSDGSHTAVFYANDTAGNMNNTNNVTFKIDTLVPLLSILLPQNTTYSTTSLQLNYTVSDTNLDKVWYLYNSANTTLTDNTTFTALNNQQSTLYMYANDTAGNVNMTNITFTVDTTPPTWNGTSTSIVTTYSPITPSQFNITWTDNTGISAVLLESNYSGSPTNYTMNYLMSPAGSVNYTFNAAMPAGTYYWRSYANDTANNWNASTLIGFTVGKADNKLHVYLDGSLDSNQTMTYGAQSNATGTADNGLSVTLDFNGSPTGTYQHIAALGVANYNYTAYSAGNANYTANSTIYYLTVQKAGGPAVTMYLNSADPNQNSTIAYGTTTNVTATTQTSQSLAIYRNGTVIAQATGTTSLAYYDSFGSSYYNFTSVAETTENYTVSFTTQFQTINKAATLMRLFLNGTEGDRNYNVGTQANLTAILNTTPATIYLNANLTGWSLQSGDTSVTSFTTPAQAGFYNITAYFPGDSNYMASSQTYFMNVSTSGSLELSADTNSSSLAGSAALLAGVFRWSNLTTIGNKTVSILWTNSTGSAKRSVNATTNSTGGYNDTYQIPENAGTWTINVTGWLDSSDYVANSTTFQVSIPPKNQLQLNLTIGNSTGQVPAGTTLKIYNSTFSSVSQLNATVTPQMLEENKNYSLIYTLPTGTTLDIRDLNVTANLTIEPIIVDSYAGSLPGYQGLRSAVLALNDSLLSYGHAELTLPINGTINRILHCISLNFSSFNCTSWESNLTSDFSAFSNSTTLKFNVTRFDAYAGSWYEPPTTPTPTPTTASSAGSGGGGGGGGGGSGLSVSLSGNKTISAGILGPFMALQAIVDESLFSPEINATRVSSLPLGISQPAGLLYFYAEVTPNFNSSRYLKQAQIDFKVNKSWYLANNLSVSTTALLRYTGAYWQSLPTMLQGDQDTESYQFSANTTSFSLFAVTAMKKTATSSTPLATPTPTPSASSSSSPVPSPTTTAVSVVPFARPPAGMRGIVIAIIVIAIMAIWAARRTGTKVPGNESRSGKKSQTGKKP